LHNHGGYERISIAALKSLRMLFDSNFGVIKPLDEIRRSFGFVPIASSCKGVFVEVQSDRRWRGQPDGGSNRQQGGR
jgi:hypothetical protein